VCVVYNIIMKIIGISGSLRKDSYNRKLLVAFSRLLPTEFSFEMIEIGEIPLFNEDVERVGVPASATALCDAIRTADGVVIATPEYNRTMSATLKNALEWASRTKDGMWDDKKVLVMGATPGTLGTATAQYDLKRVLVYLNAHVFGQPEIMVGTIHDKMDADGNIIDQRTKDLLQKAADVFTSLT